MCGNASCLTYIFRQRFTRNIFFYNADTIIVIFNVKYDRYAWTLEVLNHISLPQYSLIIIVSLHNYLGSSVYIKKLMPYKIYRRMTGPGKNLYNLILIRYLINLLFYNTNWFSYYITTIF